jgi:hypothetical protein
MAAVMPTAEFRGLTNGMGCGCCVSTPERQRATLKAVMAGARRAIENFIDSRTIRGAVRTDDGSTQK